MKILIIALPRTGSTSLQVKYKKEYKLKSIFEPFDPLNDVEYNLNENDIVVKTMMYHTPNDVDSGIDGYIKLSKQFDKTILLSRKDLKECAESWAYLKQYNHKNFNSTKPYVWKTTADFENHLNDIYKWNDELIEISKILNIDITYYEDIFDKNSNERYRKNVIINKNKLI